MPTDNERKIHELKEWMKEFCDERGWDKFHNAKELAINLSIEAAELLERFRFKSADEVEALFTDGEKRNAIEEEMADILGSLVRIAQIYDIDLSDALERKIKKNKLNYPIDKAKDSNKKYNEL